MPVVHALEGRAFVEFALSVPAENGSRASFRFVEGLVAHVRSELQDSVISNSTYRHRFRTRASAVLDKVIKSSMADGYPTLLFRVGIGQPNKVSYLPWQRHTIIGYSGIIEGIGKESGHYFELTTEDLLWDTNRGNKTRAHSGTIGEIVARIAADNGIENTVVEPTNGVGIYYQCYQGDADFIRRRLLNRAVNKKGHGNFQFFMRDNALHFHTPEYQAELKEFQFFNSSGQLLNVVDNSQKLIDAGISGCRLITYDPLTGRSTESLSDPNTTTKYAESIYKMDNLPTSQRVLVYHLGGNRGDETKAMAQSHYEAARMTTFELSFGVAKVIHIRAGDILNVLVNPEAVKVSSWSGVYYVTEVATVVDNGAIDCKIRVKRGETRKLSTDVAVQVDGKNSALTGEHEAPGQPLNLKALQASALTKGTAYKGTGASYAPVKDPAR